MFISRRPSPFLQEAFLSKKVKAAGIAALQQSVHEKELELSDKRGKHNKTKSKIEKLQDKGAYLQTEKFKSDMKAKVKNIEVQVREIKSEISDWRKSETFCIDAQDKLIISDKQSRIYDVASEEEKKRIAQNCWGI